MACFISGKEVRGTHCYSQEMEVNKDPFNLFIHCYLHYSSLKELQSLNNNNNQNVSIYLLFLTHYFFQELIRTVLGNVNNLQPFSSTNFNVFPCILYILVIYFSAALPVFLPHVWQELTQNYNVAVLLYMTFWLPVCVLCCNL